MKAAVGDAHRLRGHAALHEDRERIARDLGPAATLDGAAISSGHTVSAEGIHNLQVTASDLAGNEATPITWSFAIDETAPVLTEITSPATPSCWSSRP